MGMTSIDTFTPLESLLLIQSIAHFGTQADAFTTASASLKASELVRDHANFSEARLSEESLKNRYLRLLKDEAKQQLQQTVIRVDGSEDGQRASQKAPQPPSPQLPTVADAEKFAYLIPQLVVKLWETYQEHITGEIREDERRYNELVAGVKIAEQQRVEQIAAQQDPAAVTESSKTLTNILSKENPQETAGHPVLAQDTASAVEKDDKHASVEKEESLKQQPKAETVEGRPQPKLSTADVKISSMLNPAIPESVVQTSPKRPVELPPSAPLPLQHPPLAPPNQRRIQPNLAPATLPRTLSQQPGAPIYHQSPYEPIQARPNLAPSPTTQYPPQNTYSPVLPVPPGMTIGPPPIWSPTQNTPDRSQRIPSIPTASRHLPAPDQKRRPSLPYTDPQRPPTEQWQTPQHYAGRQHQQQPHSYHQQPSYQTSAPRGGGVMLPPFQVSPQNANASNQRALPPPSTVSAPPKIHTRPIGTPTQATTSAAHPRNSRNLIGPQTPASSTSQTPMSTILSQLLHRRRPGVTFSPGSSTGWKVVTSAPPAEEVERPLWSPVSEEEYNIGVSAAPTPSPAAPSKRAVQGPKKGTSTGSSKAKLQSAEDRSSQNKPTEIRGVSSTPSIPATASRGRTRSQSVASHMDESVLASIPKKRKIKNEPSTPALQLDEPIAESTAQSTTKGRRKQEKAPAASVTNKRKRVEMEPDSGDIDELTTPRPFHQTLAQFTSIEETQPQQQTHTPTITAFRNFQKMTVPIMNNITSHKHASLFAMPVKERDAEGYTDIIRRPQDLKSIRAAIVAGSRAIAALTTSDGVGGPGTPRGTTSSTPSASGTGAGTGATITLPWSLDLVPPRAIVNGAQLEQEVMRMFANAVMFNAGDEGVVRDTREMFESVEASIAAWRAAEKHAAETRGSAGAAGGGGGPTPGPKAEEEPDELGEVDESPALPAAKRRRG